MMALATPLETADETRVISQKYRLEALLSEGGMGSVWRALNVQLEVPVAIKLLRAGLNSDELGERLRIEARAAAKLVHPNIVRIFDIGEAESGEPFIVMELLNGESLGDLLERGPLPAIDAVRLLLPITEALSLAHSRGVIHRDLKPDNIFLAREGDSLQPKLLDFGIAKVTSSAGNGRGTLTQTGTLLGSPNYMSPEQARGSSDIDERTDIWSFCVVLHEAIAGSSLFQGSSVRDILLSVVQDHPLPLEVVAGVDQRLSALVQRGLAKEREQRPASFLDLGQELAAWLVEQGVQADAAGVSLETKWLERGSDASPSNRLQGGNTPQPQHEQATLVSVVHPRLRPSNVPTLAAGGVRGRRWLPGVALVGAALLAALGGFSLQEFRPSDQTAELPPSTPPVTASPRTRLAAVAPAVPIDALPKEPATLPAPRLSRPAPNSAALTRPVKSQPLKRPRLAAPASGMPLRDPAADLLEPY